MLVQCHINPFEDFCSIFLIFPMSINSKIYGHMENLSISKNCTQNRNISKLIVFNTQFLKFSNLYNPQRNHFLTPQDYSCLHLLHSELALIKTLVYTYLYKDNLSQEKTTWYSQSQLAQRNEVTETAAKWGTTVQGPQPGWYLGWMPQWRVEQ